MKKLIIMSLSLLFTLPALAQEVTSFNVHGFWYRGRLGVSKIAYVDNIQFDAQEMQDDIAVNACESKYVQMSVAAMLKVFGATRKIKIYSIVTNQGDEFSFETGPCTYISRGQTGRVCYGAVCVSSPDTQIYK